MLIFQELNAHRRHVTHTQLNCYIYAHTFMLMPYDHMTSTQPMKAKQYDLKI